ncbi:MAG: NAD-dependent epimerase/dehydratase family protein [Candidatus Abyssubacteria bacterium]
MAKQGRRVRASHSPGDIAITGASSFLGSRVIQALAEPRKSANTILAIDTRKPPVSAKGVLFCKIDLTDPAADVRFADLLEAHACTTVVHLAFFSRPVRDESYAHELEVIGTMHVLNACARAKVKKIILSSTTAVYGASPKNPNYIPEDYPLEGNKDYRYIRDRIEVENMARRFRESHPETIVTVLRFATILGPTVRNLATEYFRPLFVPTVMGYDPLVQFLHEEDAVRSVLAAIRNNRSGAFNIVSKDVLPLSTVISLMGRVRVPLLYPFAQPMTSALWFLNASAAPSKHLDYVRYLWVADGKRAEEELGFTPHYSTREAALSFAGAKRLREVHLASSISEL